MTIEQQLAADLAASMKAGDTDTTGVLRLIRSSMKNEQIKLGHELSEDEAMKVLQREAKQRRDSIEAYDKAGRDDLKGIEESELQVISTYLPAAMGEDELRSVVDEVIAATGATDMSKMGVVIGQVMGRVGATAEGGAVSKIVREKLAP